MHSTLLRNTFIFFLFVFNFLSVNEVKSETNYVEHKHVSLELISSVESVSNVNNLNLGLYFKLDHGWKIYWKYPGKAGYPPKIDWSKSKNIETLEILWPKPKKFKILGMESIGYTDKVVLPIKLLLKESNQELSANFNIDYLTCNKICVPYSDNLTLNIPIGSGKKSKNEKIINNYIDKSNYLTYSNLFNSDSILFFLFVAFIGGIILNFMPCVFPVLSLKIYNVLLQQKKKYKQQTYQKKFFSNNIWNSIFFFNFIFADYFFKKFRT